MKKEQRAKLRTLGTSYLLVPLRPETSPFTLFTLHMLPAVTACEKGVDMVLDGHHLSAARRSMELEERGKGDGEGGRVRF